MGETQDTPPEKVSLAVLSTKMDYMQQAIEKLDVKVSSSYVTKDEFGPTKRNVQLLIGTIVTTVVTALIYMLVER